MTSHLGAILKILANTVPGGTAKIDPEDKQKLLQEPEKYKFFLFDVDYD